MKITAIHATPVNIPYRRSALMSAGLNDQSTRTIVEVHTDAGITGLGDCSYAFAAGVIEHEFAPALVGLDPRAGAELRRYCLPDHIDFGTPLLKARVAAWGGVDIALWDLIGKADGVPVYELLGGALREAAPFVSYAYSPPDAARAPGQLAELARQSVALSGASIFEFKVGVHDVEVDIATVRAVHAALAGCAHIAIDANMGMALPAARHLLGEVAPLLENVEEPVESLHEMEQLALEYNVNVSAHCADLDAVRFYPHVAVVPTLDACGGITGVRRLAHALGAAGRRMWLRSHAESGIGWAAIVHLGIGTAELARPAQSLIDLISEDLVLGERWDVRAGGVRAPAVPGLGVQLDRSALHACHELFRKRGEVPAFTPALRRSGLC